MVIFQYVSVINYNLFNEGGFMKDRFGRLVRFEEVDLGNDRGQLWAIYPESDSQELLFEGTSEELMYKVCLLMIKG